MTTASTASATKRPGRLVIISGPSGVGKSTVVKQLLDQCDLPLALSVSATTRPPRSGEVDGRHYLFLSLEEFQRRKDAGEFLECFEPYGNGVWYGTLRKSVASGLEAGQWVILEIEVNGAQEVMKAFPAAISVFILPASRAHLERQLKRRGTEDEEAARHRLERADYELSLAPKYAHHVVNETVAQAAAEICQILKTYAVPT